LDLEEIIKEWKMPFDLTLPKFLRINVQELYMKTGLPKPAKKSKEVEKEIFMV
jgi:antitoxin component of RelBE/YafQ-DinJ toxin-antitoxin module